MGMTRPIQTQTCELSMSINPYHLAVKAKYGKCFFLKLSTMKIFRNAPSQTKNAIATVVDTCFSKYSSKEKRRYLEGRVRGRQT